ncbi:MAG: Minf_1886 family protein [Opitutus sp.]
MQDPDFAEIVGLICKEDPRFDRKAYDFIRLGLDHTVKELKSKESKASRSRHVSGPELLEGLRVYALDQFGPLTKTVLDSWGIRRCSDFGDIVFNLIEYNVFSKTDNDRREDFSDLYSFEDAFVKPFLPTKTNRGPSSAEAVGSV